MNEVKQAKNLSQYLRTAEETVESVYNEVVKSQGYTEEVEKLRILVELLKEQTVYENSGT